MRRAILVLLVAYASVLGCQVQKTNIVKTTKLPDGTEITYSNQGSGYGYNPNFTSDQNVNVNAPDATAVVGANTGVGGGSWGFGSMGGYGTGVGYAGYGGYGNCAGVYPIPYYVPNTNWGYGGYYGGGFVRPCNPYARGYGYR